MKNQLKHLLEKYLNGNCTPEEEAAVMEWYNLYANEDDHVSSLQDLHKNILKEKMRKSIDENILVHESLTENNDRKPFGRYFGYTITGIAAMLLVAYGLGFVNINGIKQQAPTVSNEKISVSNTTKAIKEYILSDGSHVWLYPGASIKFNKKFIGDIRQVTLSGESFFDVAKDAAHPFVIRSSRIITKVWGTSFKVSDMPGRVLAGVQVVTGKVSVKPVKATNQTEVMLHPNEQVTYRPELKKLYMAKVQPAAKLAMWKKVDLKFDNKPLREVIPVLNKHFNVDIKVEDAKLNDYLLNADFDGLNFVSIMQILNKTLNISYEISETDIILKKQ
ncbi:DUF4974 domain-containing protein [Mucilaginibacter limnophilus]|uniref:DUF4974 domain-containing protein n=1 Tax=Mucilaginibacter limnophilus TaxID=1932778 RepID=A0A3S2X0T7_9SPHI|nr:FecR domain-containing protein [Mucilaginibacter limnophilus]RVU02787.1 DUF4974 domain-containing protein [Mucilaginibacter limnophilus]